MFLHKIHWQASSFEQLWLNFVSPRDEKQKLKTIENLWQKTEIVKN